MSFRFWKFGAVRSEPRQLIESIDLPAYIFHLLRQLHHDSEIFGPIYRIAKALITRDATCEKLVLALKLNCPWVLLDQGQRRCVGFYRLFMLEAVA